MAWLELFWLKYPAVGQHLCVAVDDAFERVFELSAESTTMSVQNGRVLLRRYFSASLLFGATGIFFTIEGFSEELAAHIVSFAGMDSDVLTKPGPWIRMHHKHRENADPIPIIHVVWILRIVWDDTVYIEWAQRKRFHLQGQ